MKSLLAVLAFCWVIGSFWWSTPAVHVTYVTGVYVYGLERSLCIPHANVHAWKPMPQSVTVAFRDDYESDYQSAILDARVEGASELAAVKRIWLARALLQAVLVGLLLRRHRQVVGGTLRAVAWFRSNPAHQAPLMLLFVLAIPVVLIGSMFLRQYRVPYCGTFPARITSPAHDPEVGVSIPTWLGDSLPAVVDPISISLRPDFDVITWLLMAACVVLLLLSLVPPARARHS